MHTTRRSPQRWKGRPGPDHRTRCKAGCFLALRRQGEENQAQERSIFFAAPSVSARLRCGYIWNKVFQPLESIGRRSALGLWSCKGTGNRRTGGRLVLRGIPIPVFRTSNRTRGASAGSQPTEDGSDCATAGGRLASISSSGITEDECPHHDRAHDERRYVTKVAVKITNRHRVRAFARSAAWLLGRNRSGLHKLRRQRRR